MELDEKYILKCKYGLAVQKLILKNKRINKQSPDSLLDDSYGKISSSTGLRPATISSIINAISEPKAYTIHLILQTLGYNYSLFGKTLDSITDKELNDHIKQIEANRKK